MLLLVGGLWNFHTLLVKTSSGCSNPADRFSAVVTYVVGSVCSVMMYFVTGNFLVAFAEQL